MADLRLVSPGVTALFTVFGLLPQTRLVFWPLDFTPDDLPSYQFSSSLISSTEDRLDDPLLDPRLEHLDDVSLYDGLVARSTLPAGLGGRSTCRFSVELVRERGSLFLL